MKKLLVICGPTATGKTSLALDLARRYNAEIISADSRQVYKGMDIGTGKDLPQNLKSKKEGYYEIAGVKVWGYDMADPKKGFSVAQYIKIARKAVSEIWTRSRLPIVVGGTGFYIKGLVEGIPTANVKPNPKLRKSLLEKGPEELFEILAQTDPLKAGSLNASDRKNPRRLIRAIEVALNRPRVGSSGSKLTEDTLFIGLYAPKELSDKIIDLRVEARVSSGIEKEIKTLLLEGVKWGSQAMHSLGYKQWEGYFKSPNKVSRMGAIQNWKLEERAYAKRQMTWFKKDKRIKWFDISKDDYKKNIEKLVKIWYSNGNVSKN
jgi:tRNA dimethylallyltransferase